MSVAVVCSLQLGWVMLLAGIVALVNVRSWAFDEDRWRRLSRRDTAGCWMLVS